MKWLCSFKAYGDLVIPLNFLRRADPQHYGLLCGSHLAPLLSALDYHGRVLTVDVGGPDVPAFFDVRIRGVAAAAISALTLKRKIMSAGLDENDSLVFDEVGWRQRFLSWPFRAEAV